MSQNKEPVKLSDWQEENGRVEISQEVLERFSGSYNRNKPPISTKQERTFTRASIVRMQKEDYNSALYKQRKGVTV